jgi:hypothetical protein
MIEDINDKLKAVWHQFDDICKDIGCFYDIVSDESDRQGYILKDKDKTDEIVKRMAEIVQNKNIHMDVDKNRKNGVLFTFTLEAIQDDGHWQLLSKKPKRHEFSFFASDVDAKKVRAGKTIYQRKWPKKLSEQLDAIFEDDHIPTVAVDLDGTLAKDKSSDTIGDPRPGAKRAMEELQRLGYRIIIFTVRDNDKLVRNWCNKHEIPFDYINENPDQPEDGSNKIIADVYIDDRAINADGSWSKILDQVKQRLGEDQLKYPSGRHRRAQSQFRSSFHKSRTFGGVAEAIAGNMIPPHLEKSSNVGLIGAQRSNSDGESKKLRSYNDRKNAVDLPTTPPQPSNLAVELPVTQTKPSKWSRRLEKLMKRIDPDKILERTIPGTRLGRTIDQSKRHLYTGKAVPDPEFGPTADGPEDVIGANNPVLDRIEMELNTNPNVIPDDSVSQTSKDPLQAMAKKQNMRPLGVFGPRDLRQPSGGPVSNVRAQHPPDRSFDANVPKIAVQKFKKLREYLERPEDGYELLQLVVKRSGIMTQPKKITINNNTMVKACDGETTIEFYDPNKLKITRSGRTKEMELNMQDPHVVDTILAELDK